MKLYLIGGLGADERVFNKLRLRDETQVIKWIDPRLNESVAAYVKRLIKQINQEEPFCLLGVSFGGIVAIEISKIIKPKKLVLISSVETHYQLPKLYLLIGKTKILNLIPNAIIKPPKWLSTFLFSAKDKTLLHQIISDTKPDFIRWALNSIIGWSHPERTITSIRIHGTNDRVIPLLGSAWKIQDGGHFMIVDNATQISHLINRLLYKD